MSVCVYHGGTRLMHLYLPCLKLKAFSPDGTRLALNILLFDTSPFIKLYDDPVICVACSPSRDRIPSSSSDRTICVWDSILGDELLGPLRSDSLRIDHHTTSDLMFTEDDGHSAYHRPDGATNTWSADSGYEVQGLTYATLKIYIYQPR